MFSSLANKKNFGVGASLERQGDGELSEGSRGVCGVEGRSWYNYSSKRLVWEAGFQRICRLGFVKKTSLIA